jgi:hypothetical protein
MSCELIALAETPPRQAPLVGGVDSIAICPPNPAVTVTYSARRIALAVREDIPKCVFACDIELAFDVGVRMFLPDISRWRSRSSTAQPEPRTA